MAAERAHVVEIKREKSGRRPGTVPDRAGPALSRKVDMPGKTWLLKQVPEKDGWFNEGYRYYERLRKEYG
jgi:hypothetical protein